MTARIAGAHLALSLLCFAAQPLFAQSTWLAANDGGLREDVQLLIDEGVLELSASGWPLPADDLARGIRRIDAFSIHEEGLRAAFDRVAARVARAGSDVSPSVAALEVRAGSEPLLRGYDRTVRGDAEVELAGRYRDGAWSANVVATGVLSPPDGQNLRLDGSDVTYRLGNWHFSLGAPERWWGPGNAGSLILSTNARPMPQIALDRVVSTRSSVPILRWAGPWRFTALLGRMESRRADVDGPLFMGMRLSFKPLQILELGLSRTAQFCGEGRPCDFATFGRVLLGRDNKGIRVSAEKEPGNQMAGLDLRLVSPFESLPGAFYFQVIGEDSSSTAIPEKYLGLFGIEGWKMLAGGGTLRGWIEYSDTTCSFDRADDPYIDCSYRQGIFQAGYRYRGRVIGHTTDQDSEMTAAGLRWQLADGQSWRIQLRNARLDRAGTPDRFNSVTFGASRYRSAEIEWRGRLFAQSLTVQLGGEQIEPASGGSKEQLYGFAGWSWQFGR